MYVTNLYDIILHILSLYKICPDKSLPVDQCMAHGRWKVAVGPAPSAASSRPRSARQRGRCELRDVGMPLGAAATWPWYVVRG